MKRGEALVTEEEMARMEGDYPLAFGRMSEREDFARLIKSYRRAMQHLALDVRSVREARLVQMGSETCMWLHCLVERLDGFLAEFNRAKQPVPKFCAMCGQKKEES